MKKKVYISSTFEDLKEYRAAAYHTLRMLNFDVIAMEDYVAQDTRPLKVCRNDVKDCDIYVGIFAWRYGSIPEEENGKEVDKRLSITNLEYECAQELEKRCLIFLLNETTPWPPKFMDCYTKEDKKEDPGGRIQKLRTELIQNKMFSYFESPEDLSHKIGVSIKSVEHITRPPELTRLPQPLVLLTEPKDDDEKANKDNDRNDQLEFLRNAYQSPQIAIVLLYGESGSGKTYLVKQFLDDLNQQTPPYFGAVWKYAWSFYNQDTEEKGYRNSSTEFFVNTLKYYGFEDLKTSEEVMADQLVALINLSSV